MAKRKIATSAQWPASFIPADIEMFSRFRIPADRATDSGVRRGTDRENRHLGLVGKGNMAGLAFPYADPWTGDMVTLRVRRDNPELDKDGKAERKYVMPSRDKAKRILYYTHDAKHKLENRNVVIVLIESEKAALALTAWACRMGFGDRVLFVAMGGCWGWSQDKKPLQDFAWFERRTLYILLDANVANNANVREAQEALVAVLCSLQCEVHLLQLPQMEGLNGPDDLLAQPDGDALMERVFGSRTNAVVAPFSDDALATQFAEAQKDVLRYTHQWGQWLVWDNQRWREDSVQQVARLVQEFCHKAAAQSGKLSDANRMRGGRTREIVQREAGVKPSLAATVEQWDADPWLMSTPDGSVDLRTGELRPSRREDYMTKLTTAAPSGEKPARWLQFLREITEEDQELQEYLQRMSGYCLTGDTSEHAFFFLYGTGANGKSVFVNTLLGVLGEYARVASMETFMAAHNPQHPTDLAGLRGARLVAATETEDGSRWNEAKLKAVTGGERIAVRKMRQDFFEYVPQFKLLISGNHRPQLRNVDPAMQRRIQLVPFTAHFPPGKCDLQLGEKLKAERPGILAWGLEGCLAWQKNGLRPPKAVFDATTEYLEGQDVLGLWLAEKTVADRNAKTKPSELHAAYLVWAEKNNEYKWPQNKFAQKLADRGFPATKSHGERSVALRLVPKSEQQEKPTKGRAARRKFVGRKMVPMRQ
jgi:P4 family phage/plasmid primase-like protien